MKNFRENLATNIALICVLVCTAIHILILSLNAFGVLSTNFYEGFSYLTAFIFVIISLVLFLFGFFLTGVTGLRLPQWFQIVFYVAFFIFTNVYYVINAYTNIYAVMFLIAYVSFIVTIFCVSVFYNVQKDEKGKLRASKKFILASILLYSIAINSIVELAISFVKLTYFEKYVFTTLGMSVIEMCVMFAVSIIMTVIFSISLSRSKRLINGCLIKTKLK